MPKTALIFGISGQDGSYLAELLIEKGYNVYGVIRPNSTNSTKRINHIEDKIQLIYGDLTDSVSIFNIIKTVNPNEIYNFAAQSSIAASYKVPKYTMSVNGFGVLNIIEAVRVLGMRNTVKIYHTSTSDLFGISNNPIQNETTGFNPYSPYGMAKLYAHSTISMYRETYGMFISTGIAFNHESPRRPESFVTMKIVKGLYNIINNKQDTLLLGNLDARKDWGHAKDFVKAAWLMLQQDLSGDYVLATGVSNSIRDFTEKAAISFGTKIIWKGNGIDEVGIINNKEAIKVSKDFYRPVDVSYVGDYSKAKRELGWCPEITLDELIKEMCLSVQKGEEN